MFILGKMSRLKIADWTHLKPLTPNYEPFYTSNRHFISSLTETDMELRLEYEVLLLTDHDQMLPHLKSAARRIWEKAASVPNCQPLNAKISIIPQNREHKNDENPAEIRHHKLFDFGFKIPDGSYEDRTDHILAEKKLAYGSILKANEDTRKLDLEIANADPTKPLDPSNYIVPTIASVFAEHEVLGFTQLRFIKVREFRIKILQQLNYFRSIERRLVMDLSNLENLNKNGKLNDSFSAFLADMYDYLTTGAPSKSFSTWVRRLLKEDPTV